MKYGRYGDTAPVLAVECADGREAIRATLVEVCDALLENGYNPVRQLTGYLLSGDPTYITAQSGARAKIGRHDPHDVLEEVVVAYMAKVIVANR